MVIMEFNGKDYEVDREGFLVHYSKWDEDFVETTAPVVIPILWELSPRTNLAALRRC
jgi:sulfur relay (sulfurtransferase) DsrC/TusE family protein